MIDLFGMGKAPPEPAEQNEPAQPRKPQAGWHGLWLSLLVLDSIFVIVFGGAVAAKVYQYWKTPAVVVAPGVHRRFVKKTPEEAKAPEPAKPAEPAPKPPAPAPAAAKAAVKPEPRIARGAESPRPPKPSLLNEAPKPRSTPGLATSGSPSAAAVVAAPGTAASTKARPQVFQLHSAETDKIQADSDKVQLVGAFIVHGGRTKMTKDKKTGNWSVTLYLKPGQYRYFFSVDKKKTLDPENPNSDRGASLLTVH